MPHFRTSRWLPFRVVSFYNWEVYVHATGQQLERRQRVAFVILVSHECQWSGVEAGFYFTKSYPEFFLIQKRPPGDFPLRFLNRVDEAFPVASHPRGSLGNEIPLDAVLDSFHIHVSPELSQL
ncbi:hypothetical protein T4E_1613 [Trichinella pseudospiralis]|uniref:Uncharacterized protein n=1 Tax=Trichinella pseudospiralis TaxID=6337 RepID=A0A0V0XHT4_TRIPS|nr:hypothetical protein T4E_1613 [Trichinella pseudospiralis]